jgi:hypothetical protein
VENFFEFNGFRQACTFTPPFCTKWFVLLDPLNVPMKKGGEQRLNWKEVKRRKTRPGAVLRGSA